MGISEKGSGRDDRRKSIQNICGTIGIEEIDRQEYGNVSGGDTILRRLQQQIYGMTEMEVC